MQYKPKPYNYLNAYNGVALEVLAEKGYTSYDDTFAWTINSHAQDDAQFKIISIKKERGGYLIEARFTLNLFEYDGTQHKVDNGYLRLLVG